MIDLASSGRILYISSVDISIGNGPGVNEREFVLALHQSIRDRAHFLIPQPADEVPELPTSVCTFTSAHKGHSLKHFPEHVFSTIRLANQILSSCAYDLLIFRLDLMPIAPLYVTRKHRVPFALKTLGQGQMNTIAEKVSWPLGPVLATSNKFLVKELVKDALAVDTVSELQRKCLSQELHLDSKKIVCIDNAVNTHRFFPMSRDGAKRAVGLDRFNPIIGYIGNHAAHERGGTQLIQAAHILLQKYPTLGVVILGGLDGSENLIELSRKLAIQEHCVFTGYVPFHLVPVYVNALDVGVSLLAPRYYGQSELKVRQYLACGKPVIATTPGSNDFLSSENLGSLVHYDDLNTISKELDRWLSLTPGEQRAFAVRAFQYTRNHLSVERSLTKRMTLWNKRLAELQQSSSVEPQTLYGN